MLWAKKLKNPEVYSNQMADILLEKDLYGEGKHKMIMFIKITIIILP